MRSIELTKEQVEELKGFYKLELEKSFKRTNEIIAILDKLEPKTESFDKPVVQEPVPVKKIAVTVPKEENKYIKWGDVIIELLKEKQKPLTTKEISKILLAQRNIPKSDIKKANLAITQSLFRMRKVTKKIQAIAKKGTKAKLYGLPEWAKNTEAEKSIAPPKIIAIPEKKQDTMKRTYGKYNWQEFIKETLQSKKRVLNLGELANVALKHFELKSTEKTRTKSSLATVLTKLVTKDKILKTTKKKGITGKSYGLKEWFDENGNLVSLYK